MHLRAFRQLENEGKAKLVALADVNEKLLADRQKQYGVKPYANYLHMIEKEKLDGVSVATPDFSERVLNSN